MTASLSLGVSLWASSDNVLSSLRSVLLEVLVEEITKLGDLVLEGIVASGPCVPWVEKL